MENHLAKLEALESRYRELEALMTQEEVLANPEKLTELAREQSRLEGIVQKYREYKSLTRELEDTRQMLEEGNLDHELEALARGELKKLREKQGSLARELKLALLPRDEADERDVIVEIRAGAGGEEAGLFAADLFRMYSRYAASKGWEVEVMNRNETGIGGLKEIIFEVRGKGAFSRLKYESGVHRVQRVPVTEAHGRIHTSTATVAVLPEPDEVEVKINPEDLRIDTFRASGAGGQFVNKVSTAVRITHLPTGLVVTCQDERSQLKNKLKALRVLRARLLDRERSRQQKELAESRRSQVGTGERSEKIRTYNFPQSRVTDHRINLTLHNLESILEGELDELIDALATAEAEKALAGTSAREDF